LRVVHRQRRGAVRRAAGAQVILTRARILWGAVALTAVLAIAALWVVPRLQPTTGTLVVVGAGRSATTLPSSTLDLRQGDGSWIPAGMVGGSVPAAPDQAQLLEVALPVGDYTAVRLAGGEGHEVSVKVVAAQVQPLLIGIAAGSVIPGAVYAGNDDVNLGLGELSGKFVPMPAFSLVDQDGKAVDLDALAGKDVVIGAFHTTCHETCPLYTALFLQLARQAPPDVALLEVTTDPVTDTPAVLRQYGKQAGATWTFATGTADQVAAFWKPFGVEIATGDTHTSTLVLVDRHGYVRLVYRGVPKVGNDIPPSLVSILSAQGLKELASGGDGWGAPDVLQALTTIAGSAPSPAAAGGKAPAFRLTATDGTTMSLADIAGKPAVINFWATTCPPCRVEMPMLRDQVGRAGFTLVLVNEGQDAAAARDFLAGIGVPQAALLDQDLGVGREYGVIALPTTVFVKADGTIDRKQIGQLNERVLAAELSALASQ
jgi:cytochrome oxidase Cu insertion factor (SCO1/SenC/PrrC family)